MSLLKVFVRIGFEKPVLFEMRGQLLLFRWDWRDPPLIARRGKRSEKGRQGEGEGEREARPVRWQGLSLRLAEVSRRTVAWCEEWKSREDPTFIFFLARERRAHSTCFSPA